MLTTKIAWRSRGLSVRSIFPSVMGVEWLCTDQDLHADGLYRSLCHDYLDSILRKTTTDVSRHVMAFFLLVVATITW